MRSKTTALTASLIIVLLAVIAHPSIARAQADSPEAGGVVRVGMLVYGGGKTSICFAEGFLATVARETDIRMHRQFEPVVLTSDDLFNYPFVVMTGEGAFSLSDGEAQRLGAYIARGGFVLASSGCSNAAWTDSFRAVVRQILGDDALQPLDLEHPLFHTLYDISAIEVKKRAGDPTLYGHRQNGRLAVVFSPLGLNDSANAGEGCCCCGGNEIRNAQEINANVLIYALTH